MPKQHACRNGMVSADVKARLFVVEDWHHCCFVLASMKKIVKKTEKKLVLTQSRVRRLDLSGVTGGNVVCDPSKVQCGPGGSACMPTCDNTIFKTAPRA